MWQDGAGQAGYVTGQNKSVISKKIYNAYLIFFLKYMIIFMNR